MVFEHLRSRLFEKDRLVGLLVMAVFALFMLLVPPYFGVTQLRPLGASMFAAIALSFFHQKEEE